MAVGDMEGVITIMNLGESLLKADAEEKNQHRKYVK